jgi:wyosine [tRNA(Phe)-imidazoG37] synthetase (radical SAM superfamily)
MISQLQEDVVQGPLDHPRFGRALVVRPTIETQRAGRYPTQAVVVTAAARRLIELSREGDKIQAVVVEKGDHDPTRHPEFTEITENLRELVNKHFPKAKFNLISDAPDIGEPNARHAVCYYDQPILRLEAGYQKTFAALSGEEPAVFKPRVENMSRIESERLVVQATFVRGEIDNSKDSEVKAWIRHLADIKPAVVHISTPAKARPDKCRPITKTRINEIAELVTAKTGIPVEVEIG